MRVLVAGHSYINRFGQQKLDAIAASGITLALLAPSNWRHLGGLFDGQPCPLELPPDSFRVFGGPVIRPGHSASFWYARGVVRRVMREFSPDLVQIEQEVYSFATLQIALAARAAGKKIVVFSWENLDRRIHPLQRLSRWITLRKIHAIISGNSAGVDLVRKWGFRGQTTVIPQVGVDTADFSPRPRDAARRFTLGFVGRLVPEKGVQTLLQATARLLTQGKDVGALLCGAGPERERLARLADEPGMSGRVEWQDSVPHAQVPDVMARMDVLVLPSVRIAGWAEQFGLVLAQAMAMGIPVLGSDSGAIPEVIGRDDAIFPAGDADVLASLVAGIIAAPQHRAELSAYGIERVRSLYSRQRVAERTVEYWRQLTNAAPGT